MYSGYLSSWTPINQFLYLGGYLSTKEAGLIKDLGITLVVDATNFYRKPPDGVEYVKVNVDDTERSNLSPYFDRVADRIKHHRDNGGSVIVHCAAGISRSTALTLAYFVKHEGMNLSDAYQLVHEKRPIVAPNTGFWKQLIAFEKKVRGMNSVNMTRTKYREIPDCYLTTTTSSRKATDQAKADG